MQRAVSGPQAAPRPLQQGRRCNCPSASLRAGRAVSGKPVRAVRVSSQGNGQRGRVRGVNTTSQLQVDRPQRERSPNRDDDARRELGTVGNRSDVRKLPKLPFNSVPEMWSYLACRHGDLPAVHDKHHTPAVSMTFRELEANAAAFAGGLQAWGVGRGDVVAQFADNSHRWLIADAGILTSGAVNAVRGSAAPVEELAYILGHSEARALIVEDASVLAKLLPALSASSVQLAFVCVLWGGVNSFAGHALPFPVLTFDQIVAAGKNYGLGGLVCEMGTPSPSNAPRTSHRPAPTDVATIVYTSGTTGTPRGACITHGNLMYQMAAFTEIIKPVPGESALSLLPIWHIYERTAAYYIHSCGAALRYSNVKALKGDLADHPPEYMLAVPLVLSTLQGRVDAALRQASAIRRTLVSVFLAASLALVRARRVVERSNPATAADPESMGERLLAMMVCWVLTPVHAVADMLAYRKIRKGLGVSKCIVSGGGALAPHLDDWYETVGVNVLNGWGLTETSPVLACRRPENNVRGSVGTPLAGTQLRVVHPETREQLSEGEQGLILARGPGVMAGYYHDAAATARAIDANGWFDTGDLGWVVPRSDGCAASGSVVLVGRVKDTIVLSNGENVEPGPIEDACLQSPFIKQIMLVGTGERHLAALVVADTEALEAHAAASNKGTPLSAEQVHELIGSELFDHIHERPGFRPDERVTRWTVLYAPWGLDDGSMTRTFKLRRAVVEARHAKEIKEMFHRQ